LGKAFGAETSMDGNGHGTHVATTIVGKEYGVAKKANVVCVKVLSDEGSGAYSDVIAGIQWAASDAKGKKAVANMSLGGPASKAVDKAVQSAVKSGLFFAVAAGNESDDACRSSPARVKEVVTVAASTKEDEQAEFSNYGKCVDVFAPGNEITAGWFDGATKTISGTSMASPHVAGVAAVYLAENKVATAASLQNLIVSKGVKNLIKNPSDETPNVMVNVSSQ
jgi:subtilisin family serine protease